MPLVSVFMDVEDPINPLADPAALDVARLFTEAGVRGSFCLTGEKCRSLVLRERRDVIEAFAPHCLGLHTDTHSYHPTTMELLAEVSYEEGCGLAHKTEQRGMNAFRSAFGRAPIFWGGAGNTWSPEITDVLKREHLNAYVYALTSVPNNGVHLFNGLLALPQSIAISEEDWANATSKPGDALAEIAHSDAIWLGVFVGHPTKLRHKQYWDTPYAAGRTPPEPEYAEPVSDEVYLRSLENLCAFLTALKDIAEVVGVDQLMAMPMEFRDLTEAELAFFREQTAANIRSAAKWPIHRSGLDVERIVEKTLALEHTLRIAIPDRG